MKNSTAALLLESSIGRRFDAIRYGGIRKRNLGSPLPLFPSKGRQTQKDAPGYSTARRQHSVDGDFFRTLIRIDIPLDSSFEVHT